ncbi:hypothetical protein AB0H57_24485 [Micromonospora sp. NPDC050686]|uniref:hypothetical protein n=1 Tax=Micromonospora sp. NPDC050686 TaxID=3154631 RepID=UPI0033FB9A61
MSRPDRWWRPTTSRRPAQRTRARRMYSGKELDTTFDLGYTIGQADERKRHQQRDEQITRLARAADAAQNGDPSLLDEIAREAAADDLLDVADAAGATPLPVADPDRMVDELERWLREQG